MRRTTCLTLAGVLALALPGAGAQDLDAPKEVEIPLDRTPESCLQLTRISRTRVVDDETVLFYVRGGDVYQNVLPRTCNGLKRNDRFMYQPFSNRLCDTDMITVLEQFGGRFDRGMTCRLGEFYPISELEAEELMLASDEETRSRRGGGRIEVEPVELPESDEDTDDADAEPTDD